MQYAYITSTGSFLPGEVVSNDQIEERLGQIGGKPSRLKKRILKSNGIVGRHYALDDDGNTTMLNEELAANAVLDALRTRGLDPQEVGMLAAGTTQGDLPVPGFASMVHGRIGSGPLEALTAGGVCGSGFAALRAAANAVRLGDHASAVAVGSEQVSRIMKASRFDSNDDDNMDAEFLRWMLSDGAGAVVIEGAPRAEGLSLRIDWTHVRSHAHAHDVCMYAGTRSSNEVAAGGTWLDHPTVADADQVGAMNLRQDIRRLPEMVALGVNEYVRLLEAGMVDPDRLDHVLCHYSSEFFRSSIFKMMADLGVFIGEERWYSNLTTRGNTGAASIYIMLDEAMRSGRFSAGESILLMVPESGRFSVSFAHLTVVEGSDQQTITRSATKTASAAQAQTDVSQVNHAKLMGELADVWADFEVRLGTVPVISRIENGEASLEDYKALLVNMRQQVAEGARWITRAASNIDHEHVELRSDFVKHAAAEQRDFQMLEHDFVRVGGELSQIRNSRKNIGSEALSAFMFERANQANPFDLLGAMFVIEGLGARKALRWASQLQDQLDLDDSQVSFLVHHGAADDQHTATLTKILHSDLITEELAKTIARTARIVARLYVLQLEELEVVA